MSTSSFGPSSEPTPDFGWPYYVAEFISEWLNGQWQNFQFGARLPRRPFPRVVVQTLLWSSLAYTVLVWACFCYIDFPVSPYGLWDIMTWVIVVSAVTLAAIYTIYAGGVTIVLLVSVLLSIAIYLTLSVSYLSWVLSGAVLKRSPWLIRYRFVMLTGLGASVVLATFVDGSYRFWDAPFEVISWAKLFLISASAWAALFCHLVRNKVMEPASSRAVVKWTVGLTIGFGVFAFFGASFQKAEYFLRKNVVEHPKEASAWLDLAWH
jgi:hypothetical protein